MSGRAQEDDGRGGSLERLAGTLIEIMGAGSDTEPLAMARELSETRAALRRLSHELGCDDWPDDLYLPDVIEKHIGRAVRTAAR